MLRRYFVLIIIFLSSQFTEAEGNSKADNSSTKVDKSESSQSPIPKRILKRRLKSEQISVSIGSYFSQGDYGIDQDTEILNFPLRVSYRFTSWSLSAQMPFSYIEGPARVIGISNGIEIIDTRAEGKRQRWGNGDLKLSTRYQFNKTRRTGIVPHIGTSVKAPTASQAADLGTGEWDVSVFTGGFKRFGKWMLNARIGYQWMGDTARTNYNNRVFASLGSNWRIDRRKSIGMSAYFKQASTTRSEPIRSLSSYINWRINADSRISFSLGKGFSEASADVFGGVQFTQSFSLAAH